DAAAPPGGRPADADREQHPPTRSARGRATLTRRLSGLLPNTAVLGGVLAAVVALARVVHSVATRGSSGLFNDFYDYWAAGVLLNRGQDPYDIAALHAVQRAAGLQIETGAGYSYPLFFAHLLRPLALIAAPEAAFIFMALSLITLACAIALLLGSIPRLSWPVALVGGAAAGLFPPVIGSLYFGQANLLVLLLLLVAVAILAALTVVVLLLAAKRPWEGALALSLWLGVVAAPKNSLWNFTPLLLCIAFIWTAVRGRWWIVAVGVAGWLLLELQA